MEIKKASLFLLAAGALLLAGCGQGDPSSASSSAEEGSSSVNGGASASASASVEEEDGKTLRGIFPSDWDAFTDDPVFMVWAWGEGMDATYYEGEPLKEENAIQIVVDEAVDGLLVQRWNPGATMLPEEGATSFVEDGVPDGEIWNKSEDVTEFGEDGSFSIVWKQ